MRWWAARAERRGEDHRDPDADHDPRRRRRAASRWRACRTRARPRSGRRIGVLPESAGYPEQQTGAEFLRYHARLFGHSRASARATSARRCWTQVGLAERGRSRIGTYSRGMRQRLGIARALVNEPAGRVLRRAHARARPGRPAAGPAARRGHRARARRDRAAQHALPRRGRGHLHARPDPEPRAGAWRRAPSRRSRAGRGTAPRRASACRRSCAHARWTRCRACAELEDAQPLDGRPDWVAVDFAEADGTREADVRPGGARARPDSAGPAARLRARGRAAQRCVPVDDRGGELTVESRGWAVVARQELRDLWLGGRGLLLVLRVQRPGQRDHLCRRDQRGHQLPREARDGQPHPAGRPSRSAPWSRCSAAADAISGERERGTLESLLLTPAPRRASGVREAARRPVAVVRRAGRRGAVSLVPRKRRRRRRRRDRRRPGRRNAGGGLADRPSASSSASSRARTA